MTRAVAVTAAAAAAAKQRSARERERESAEEQQRLCRTAHGVSETGSSSSGRQLEQAQRMAPSA